METTATQTYGQTAGEQTPVVITRRKDVPQAPLYITATIPHLSGWGEAEGKSARAIYPVPNHETARRVSSVVKDRLNGQRIHTCATRPEINTEKSVNILFDYRGLL